MKFNNLIHHETRIKKEPKVVCVHVHPGAIATPP